MTDQPHETCGTKPTNMHDIDTTGLVNELLEVFGSTSDDSDYRRRTVTGFVNRVGTALVTIYNVENTSLFNHIFSTVFNAMVTTPCLKTLKFEDSEPIMLEAFKETKSEIPTKLTHPLSRHWHMTPHYEGKRFLLLILLNVLFGSVLVTFGPGRGLLNLLLILVGGFISGIAQAWLIDKLATWETNKLFDRHMTYLAARTQEIVEYKHEHGQIRDALEQMQMPMALSNVVPTYLN